MNNLLKKLSGKYKNILVTGGAGAIGGNLLKLLLKGDIVKIVVIDDLSSGYLSNIPKHKKIVFVRGDIADPKIVNRAFANKINLVFHLAAHFANQNSIENPVKDLISNGIGTVNLLESSVGARVKKFVYFSTSCVYKNKSQKLKESDLDFQFETPYAISKYVGEKYVKFYSHYYNLPVVILRIFNSFGPGERPGRYRNVIPNFLHRALNKQDLIITGTGEETRNFTFVEDICRGAILAACSGKAVGKVVNLGGSKEISILELANRIKKMTNSGINFIFRPRRKWDNSISRRGNLALARKLLGFRAETSFEDGLAKTCEWMIGEIKNKRI